MRLVSFLAEGAQAASIGRLDGDGILDLRAALPGLPTDMIDLLELGEDALQRIADLPGGTADYRLNEVRLRAPVPRPRKIVAIGLNYRLHAEEAGLAIPEVPLVFTKQSTSSNGPFAPIFWSAVSRQLDYEGELAVIIGRRCRRVPKEHAASVIAGYCVLNDVSVRDWQTRGTPPSFTMGKSWDSHCPMGPALVTREDIDNPHTLGLRTRVNGQLRQDARTDDMIFNCFELIEFLSTAFTLEPGDVIATGTPSGVGVARRPPDFLVPGDVVRVEIDGLGHIENRVVEEPGLAGTDRPAS